MPERKLQESYQIISKLNLEYLKWLAILTMVIDHFFLMIIGDTSELSTHIGRISAPLFIFLVVINTLYHSKNTRKYSTRLLTLAILSQVITVFSFEDPFSLNICFTLTLCVALVSSSQKYLLRSEIYYYLIMLVIFVLMFLHHNSQIKLTFEYDYFALMFALTLTSWLIHRQAEYLLYLFIITFSLNFFNSIAFLALVIYLPLVYFSAKKIKYFKLPFKISPQFFYFLYPGHLLILLLLKNLI